MSVLQKLIISYHWNKAHKLCGLKPDWVELKRVFALYETKGRFYHTLRHVAECLAFMTRTFPHEYHPAAVVALIYHDCVYDVKATENEEKSAAEFDYYAHGIFSDRFITRVNDLILATRSHKPVEDRMTQIVLDSDLHILAAPWGKYKAYAKGVYHEYASFGEEAYLKGRTGFLAGARNTIRFSSQEMQMRNTDAQRNIETELNFLVGSPKEFLGY